MSSSFIGKVLDNYRIIENLGIGGMGVVFKAIHIKLDKIFALKMIAPSMVMNENFIKRFQTEAKALAKFENTNIVRIYDLRSDNDQWFIVMEYVDGINLLDKIKKEGAFPWQEALPILKQMLMGIGHAHSAGIVHRDIKPNNVMLTKNGTVKVTDFGLAKDQTSISNTMTVASGGTLYYMSPEHVKGFSFTDKRSDIYSVGMTFYEMITGSVPFKDISSDFELRETIVRKEIAKPTTFNPDIPVGLETIVMKSIAKNPDERYQSTDEMLQAVSDFEIKSGISEKVKIPTKKDKTSKVEELNQPTENRKFKTTTSGSNIKKRNTFLKIGIGITAVIVILFLLDLFYGDVSSPMGEKEVIKKLSSISISSIPDLATVYLSGDSIGQTPLKNYSIEAGQYSLQLVKENYQLIDTTVYLNRTKNLAISFQLETLPQKQKVTGASPIEVQSENTTISTLASVVLRSNPPRAEIKINGKQTGKTPMKLQNLEYGNYLVEIEKVGYKKYSNRLQLNPGLNPAITANLFPLTGRIQVTTEPPLASAILDGREITGKATPLTVENIPIGKHQLEIHKQGYKPIIRELEIKEAGVNHINVQLIRQKGVISVQVRPWGSIYLNDQLQKESTDLKYQLELPVDQYDLKVTHPTLGKWAKTIKINPDVNTKIIVDFNQKMMIHVAAADEAGNPLTGDIFVDDENTGKSTPAELNIRVGMHHLTVKKEGFNADNGGKEILVDKDLDESQILILKKVK